jgi:hypothetical protein
LLACGSKETPPVTNAHVLYATSYSGEHGFDGVYDYIRQCVITHGEMMNNSPPQLIYMVDGLFVCSGFETSGCCWFDHGIWLTKTTSGAQHLTYAHELIHHFTYLGKEEETSEIFKACDPSLNHQAYLAVIAFYLDGKE